MPIFSQEWGRPKSAVMPAVLTAVLYALGLVLLGSTQLFLVEQYVCRDYYTLLEPAMLGAGGLIDEELCKVPEIQSIVASILGIDSFLSFIPGMC